MLVVAEAQAKQAALIGEGEGKKAAVASTVPVPELGTQVLRRTWLAR